MKLLSLLLVIMILASAFAKPPGLAIKMNAAKCGMMKNQQPKPGGCNKSKQHTNGAFCYYCLICFAFVIPARLGVQRNLLSRSVNYPDVVQSELSDYNPSCWRPPNA
ncbi:MAG: hypothetical protein M3N14_04630 [Bacteroidota bacterium]|nr:hypothetical protein [Bacteroidota bacterium]